MNLKIQLIYSYIIDVNLDLKQNTNYTVKK